MKNAGRSKEADEFARTTFTAALLRTTDLADEHQTWQEFWMGSSTWCAEDIADLSDDSQERIYTSASTRAMDEAARLMELHNHFISFHHVGDTATLDSDNGRERQAVDVSVWWRKLCAHAESEERSRLRALLITRPEDV